MAMFITSAKASIPGFTSSSVYQRNHSSPASFLPSNTDPAPSQSTPAPPPPPTRSYSLPSSSHQAPIPPQIPPHLFNPSPQVQSPPSISTSSLQDILWELHELEEKFQKANEQYNLLSEQLQAVRRRYERASRPPGAPLSSLALCWSLRPRVVTLENVCDMFWQYMDLKADRLDELREVLLREHGLDWDIVADHMDFS